MNNPWYHRPVLTGQHVRLEPLTPAHAPDLFAAGADPDIWTWLRDARPTDLDDMRRRIDRILADPDRLAFVQIDPAGRVAGTTSYYEIDPTERGLYIGHTWIGAPWRRTGVNTEAKLMLLRHAFDTLGANRVGWHTDINNLRSQRAIERLGARREGVLRAHRIRRDGSLRDTVVYSVIAAEWPSVRERLEARLRPAQHHPEGESSQTGYPQRTVANRTFASSADGQRADQRPAGDNGLNLY
ncbi:Protein N-acetyltransferase, RimJ/RimL family [Goodfellowiella coeruleoviolacea]|uniref:Protein N-acetyltransferase, RimJ/RimL family n=1 Tax=Goodfellowiella coeruleoviolacea TaxID=334858 RepID=A0AAE3GC06_9PSEU|nr:Protein N-acetyltransferase, RimJ/RimL family [Goodfellowiella coeruleoviolacea]